MRRILPRQGRHLLALSLALFAFAPLTAQNQNQQQAQAQGFFESSAQFIYKAAWPSATYREWHLDGFTPITNGFEVTLTISGQSYFDNSNLWLRLAVPIRNGSVGTPRVLSHNAQIAPPFQTSIALGTLATQLAQRYNSPQQGASSPATPAIQPTTGSPATLPTGQKAAIVDVLAHWRAAILANDASSEAALYAPVVQSYYGRSQISQLDVQKDKAAFIDRGYHITQFNLEDVTFEILTSSSARLQLVKDATWTSPSGVIVHKLIPSHLDMQLSGAGWMISGERDGR